MFVRVPTKKLENTCNSPNKKSQRILVTVPKRVREQLENCNSTNKKNQRVTVPTKRVREYL